MKWKNYNTTAAVTLETPVKTFKLVEVTFFLNIQQLLKIACTLLVTSVECERSISSLRLLKTYLRSSMREERLNGLAMLFIHRNTSCDAEEVVEQFARQHLRRLQFCTSFDQDDK